MIQKVLNQEWLDGLLDFVFPPICLGCGEFDEGSDKICSDCFNKIEPFDYPLCLNCQAYVPKGVTCPVCSDDSVLLFAFADYKSPMKEIIIQFKFKGITSPAKTFANLAVDKFGDKLKQLKADILIPIPLHPTRENHRGYNQAELIAYQLSELLSIPVSYNSLKRVKKRQPQARLNFEKRMSNIKGAFAADDVEGKKVILVDDVVTSGATVLEAKKVLESADYKVVGIISIAHGV